MEHDDGQQWQSEYAEWAEEQDRLEKLTAILRAARDGTIYDPRSDDVLIP